MVKSYIRSCNCPWISPQIVTGALTGTVLLSYAKMAVAFSVINLTCFSVMDLKFLRLDIVRSIYARSLIQILQYMLSQKEIRSLIWIEYEEGQEENQENGEQILDISHQELRRLKEFQLKQLDIQKVNASYNFFKDFSNLNFKEINQQTDISITWLDISFNFIKQIDQSASACHMLKYLRYLNVTANQLESVDFKDLDVPMLQTLNVSNNKIKYFIHCPESLKVLTINDNLLTSLAFTGGKQLNILLAKENKIKKIGLTLQLLYVLDIESNRVDDIDMVKQFLHNTPDLLSINFRDNPICKSRQYKIAVLQNCQGIGQIDETIISPHIRQGFKVIKAEEQLNQMLDRVNKKYEHKLSQKQRIKDELVRKIRAQEKHIQEQYYKGVAEEREQLELLEKKAESVLAKNKLGIPGEKNQFVRDMHLYAEETEEEQGVKDEKEGVQRQHYIQYLDFMNKRRPYSSQNPKTKIKKIKSKQYIEPPQEDNDFPDLRGIVLFDHRAVGPLLNLYEVQELIL